MPEGLQFDQIKSAQQGLSRDQIAINAQNATANLTIPKFTPISTSPSNIPVSNTAISPDMLKPQTPVTVPTIQPSPVQQPLNVVDQLLKDSEVPDTANQQLGDNLSRAIYNLLPNLQGQGAELANQQNIAGVNTYKKELQDLNTQILTKQAEINQDDIKLIAQTRDIERQPGMLSSIMSSQQAKNAQDAAIIRALKTAEIGVLNARAIAKQGDVNLAIETAKSAVDAKYAPYKEAIDIYKQQLEAIQPILNRDEKKQAAQQQLKIELALKDLEERKAEQKADMALILSSGLQNKYVNKQGKFVRTSDGKAYETPEEFFRDAGVSSFEEAYSRGLVGDLSQSLIAEKALVNKMATEYFDAGILPTDSLETAKQKLQYSAKYYKDTYVDDSFTLSEGQVRYNGAGEAIGKGPTSVTGGYSQKQLSALTKLNESISKNDTYSKTSSMRTYMDNVSVALSQRNGLSDIAAINQFQKVIDEGAVTRDQDVKLIQGSQSLVNSLKLKINKLEKGDQLTEQQREQMRAAVEGLYNAQTKALLNDPYIKAKTKEAELYGLSGSDTILSEIAGFDRTAATLMTGDPPPGEIWVRQKATGEYGSLPANEFNPNEYEKISDKAVSINRNTPGLTFNSAGNASASNQVKGYRESIAQLPLLNMDGNPKTPNIPLTKAFPDGSIGGQCGDFVRKVVSKIGATYPTLGDSLKSKTAAVKKYGTSLARATIGSVIVTKENPTYGHVAYIIGRNAKGWIVAESNFKQSNRVSYGRTIPFNSPKVIGVINPTKKA